jgi:hypothetical protein
MATTVVLHTEGPWTAVSPKFGEWHVQGLHGDTVARIEPWTPGVDEGDARLIAAAPTMLNALLYALDLCEAIGGCSCPNPGNYDEHPPCVFCVVQEAIREAQGR